MKKILFFILLAACSQANPRQILDVEGADDIRPGDVRWIEVRLEEQPQKIICEGKEVKFSFKDGVLRFFKVLSYFSTDLKKSGCVGEFKVGARPLVEFTVTSRKFPEERLKVNPRTIKLDPKDQERVAQEQKILNEIYTGSKSELLFHESFILPMNSFVTSYYGVKRTYNKQHKGQHLGTDFRAPIGEKVPAANAGKIVFAGELFYTGHTVIIDHGQDIFTVYGHLSETLVKAGQNVGRGQLIGLSGNTGRSSGPHLHWGVKVQGQYIDGEVLIQETKKRLP